MKMQVEWIDVDHEVPNQHMYQISDQVVVKTAMGYLGTGYYSHRHQRWELDGLLSNQDFITHWLMGLE